MKSGENGELKVCGPQKIICKHALTIFLGIEYVADVDDADVDRLLDESEENGWP
jgi:hypothetical protein